MESLTLVHLHIGKTPQIGLKFGQSRLISALLKGMRGVKWSEEFRLHYMANNPTNLQYILDTFQGQVWVDMQKFTGESTGLEPKPLNMKELRNRKVEKNWKTVPKAFYDELEMRRYSMQTARTYVSLFERFINAYKHLKVNELGEREIKAFLLQKHEEDISDSLLNQYINAIKFYYEVVMGMPNRFYAIRRPKKKQTLPVVLSKEEVIRMLQHTSNLKHRCIIAMLYGAGLRRGELQKLELTDIDSKRMLVRVRDAKGGKDRMTLLSKHLLMLLRIYYKAYKPKRLLFEGVLGKPYSGNSITSVVKRAAEDAKVLKAVTPHTLRHSFATHLLESGTDLRYIQVLMGHSSSKTTEVYTHVAHKQISSIESPLDCLSLEKT